MAEKKTRVGIIGLGGMGWTHLLAYAKRDDVEVVALADPNPGRLSGEVRPEGNIEGQFAGDFDLARVGKRYADPSELIADPEVEAVDVCTVTPLHLAQASEALAAGKHLLLEKPVARTAADAREIAAAAARAAEAHGVIAMPAHCLRFWPGWAWLKERIAGGDFGRVLGARFSRHSTHPQRRFFLDGEACGGALLDFHIHDVDFILHCFGRPAEVISAGYSQVTGAIDHVTTLYRFPEVPLVEAEASWCFAPGFDFNARYVVNFERATAVYDSDGGAAPVTLYREGAEPTRPEIPEPLGFAHEIAYFLDCIRQERQPRRTTLEEAAEAIAIVEAEERSIREGRGVVLGGG